MLLEALVALGAEVAADEKADGTPPALPALGPVLQVGQLYVLAEPPNGDDDRAGVFPTHPGQFAADVFLVGICAVVDALVDVVAVVLDVEDEGPQFVQVKESVRPV